jgi:TnpA family transposase
MSVFPCLFIFTHHNTFSLATPPEEASENEQTLHDLFSPHTYISLLEVLSTINSSCNYLDRFQHFQNKYLHPRPADCTFYAGIMALGCNIGIHRIIQTAPLINESELNTTINWYFTLENINTANDAIGLFIDTLDLPNIYMRDQKRPHTSSDGQKRNVLPDSLNAGSSYKYFGQRKGASDLSFIDERHFLFHGDVINVNEREVLYVIDGLLRNEVVKSYMHSVDMHGYSETIFGATHLLGYYLAPRIKGLPSRQLYSFEKIRIYEEQGFKILPHKYINVDIIREHWDDLLRLIATIKLKLTPASQIFKRLTSYAKQHTLYQALKAFGQIIKTQFILEYIDDVELRQAIEKQLNKVEHSHKFADAVFYGNNQEFTQATKEEQEKAEACKRLIQNAIVLWNYLYLSKKIMDETDREKRKQLLKTIQSGSVVTWAHIHLHGEFDFSENKLKDSMGFNMSQILALKVTDNWDMEKQAFSLN